MSVLKGFGLGFGLVVGLVAGVVATGVGALVLEEVLNRSEDGKLLNAFRVVNGKDPK